MLIDRFKMFIRDSAIHNTVPKVAPACVLWPDKDRGKDVGSAPWYPVFKGDRINDYHLTLAEKKAAQGTGE